MVKIAESFEQAMYKAGYEVRYYDGNYFIWKGSKVIHNTSSLDNVYRYAELQLRVNWRKD